MAKELRDGEQNEIPYGYAYYHFIIHTMTVQRLKQKEIMDYIDPETDTGKNNLLALGFSLSLA
jgi:hypothetical protein